MRYGVAGLVIVGLALGVWLLWPQDDAADPVTTTLAAAPTTTTQGQTTTTAETPTTSADGSSDSHVVTTVEEAEEILRDLWFGWFEGIYNQDVDRIREVVATEDQVATGVSQFETAVFARAPALADLGFVDTEILRSDTECLSVWTELSLTGFREGSSENVHVVRFRDGQWVLLGLWVNRDDLWDADCESQL